jgi:hypothetical protein
MYSTTVYLYQQITKVLLVDTSGGYFTSRYDPVYAKSLTVNKGVDNVLLFEFINQEEKPVNITGSNFVFRLMNQSGNELLLEKSMDILSASLGRVKVVLDSADTINITAQPASYSIQRTSGNYVQAAYVDANSQARADCNIVDSILPTFVPSGELTIPTIYGKAAQIQPGPTNWPDWALQPPPVNTTQLTEFFSSYIPTNDQRLTTIKMDLDTYTGTIKVQAAENYESVWVDVTESTTYLSHTGSIYINVEGYHPLLRVAFNNSKGFGAMATINVTPLGVVESINVTNTGQGYIAIPRVQILGNGSGAEAECISVSGNGTIGPIIVTAGGSGYWPTQYQSTQQASVLITNGYVTNLQYR